MVKSNHGIFINRLWTLFHFVKEGRIPRRINLVVFRLMVLLFLNIKIRYIKTKVEVS